MDSHEERVKRNTVLFLQDLQRGLRTVDQLRTWQADIAALQANGQEASQVNYDAIEAAIIQFNAAQAA